jgi:tol-pal system protein YbgF
MRSLPLGLLAFCLVPGLAFAQKREFVDLQRDVAALQDQVRALQQSDSENMGKMTALIQQAIDTINKVNTNIALLDKSLTSPVANVGTKVDSMANEFQSLRVSLDDVSSKLAKLQQGLIDLNNTVKVISAPPAPPAPAGGAQGAAGPPPGVTSESLYSNAMRDKDSGNYDIAQQEYTDYLKFYSSSEMAPNAQYYIGEIYYTRKDYENALQAFDAVLERFPDNNKTLDAMYMKGRTLFQMGERTKAANEFRAVYARSPRSDLAAKAKAQLASMGLSVSGAAPHRKKQ